MQFSEESANKILILDDDKLVTKTLCLLLNAQTDYEIYPFNSPLEALEYVRENEIDLIISDFLMPEMNGIEFLSEVKKIKPSITNILLTGYADKENAIKFLNVAIDIDHNFYKKAEAEPLFFPIKTYINFPDMEEEQKIENNLNKNEIKAQEHLEKTMKLVGKLSLNNIKLKREKSKGINKEEQKEKE